LKKIFDCEITERERLLSISFKKGDRQLLKEILGKEIPDEIIEAI
jgi:hypothetical protein